MTTPPPHGQNPYAQTPPPPVGQQPGQPGVPPQGAPYAPFPQQAGPAGPGAPVPPPAPLPPAKKGGKKALRIIGVIVLAIIIGVIKFGVRDWLTESDAHSTSVGACMHNDGTESKPDLSEVDCSSSKAQFKVVQKFADTTDDSKCEAVKEATISYVEMGDDDVVLCLKEA
ncbi:LppU/SCO3897 family protein [Streptomyces sp. NPDC003299]